MDDAFSVQALGATIATGAASARVAIPVDAAGNAPKYCRLAATTACYVKVGKGNAINAASGDMLVQPADAVIVKTVGSDYIAALRVTADGVLQISPLEDA